MNHKFVIVFTGEDLTTLKQRGGTGNWTVNSESFLDVKYVFLVRNLKKSQYDNKADGYEHGQAWLLGKVQATKPSREDQSVKLS